jgi:hypothetical protein
VVTVWELDQVRPVTQEDGHAGVELADGEGVGGGHGGEAGIKPEASWLAGCIENMNMNVEHSRQGRKRKKAGHGSESAISVA